MYQSWREAIIHVIIYDESEDKMYSPPCSPSDSVDVQRDNPNNFRNTDTHDPLNRVHTDTSKTPESLGACGIDRKKGYV